MQNNQLMTARRTTQQPDEAGGMLILSAICSIGLLAVVGLAVDTSQAMKNQRKTQNAADSAALAGSDRYKPSEVDGAKLALTEAKRYAELNYGVTEAEWTSCVDHPPAGFANIAGVPGCLSINESSPVRIRVRVPSKVSTTFSRVTGVSVVKTDGVATARVPEGIPATPYSVEGSIAFDSNGDGVPTPGEGGVSSALTLEDSTGNVVGSTSSSTADGSYSLIAPEPGTYVIHSTVKAGYIVGPTTPGTNGSFLPAATTGQIGVNRETTGNNFTQLQVVVTPPPVTPALTPAAPPVTPALAPALTPSAAPVTPVGPIIGVAGGHFDVDLYDKARGPYNNRKHVHQYDDKYNVTGVDFLNPSEPQFNLANAIPDPTTNFKILAANQYLSPASEISIGGASSVPVKSYGQLASNADPVSLLASLPTYNRNTIGTFTWSLPLDAFATKNWWGDGVLRAGLIPTQTGCVNKITSSVTGATGSLLGPNGERFDGALTFTMIAANTPSTALELANAAGGAKFGWRVKATAFVNVLAEYTLFWHHGNNPPTVCYGQAGWMQNAPLDPTLGRSSGAPAPGSTDPTGGRFIR